MSVPDMWWRAALRCAFLGLRAWWFVRRPEQHGALALIWVGDRVLLLRNSYQPLWSAPGGGVGRSETAIDAVAREIREEIGLRVPPADLRPLRDVEVFFRYRRDRVSLFELRLPSVPDLRIDRREVIETRWFERLDASRLRLLPHLAEYFSGLPDGRPADGEAARDV